MATTNEAWVKGRFHEGAQRGVNDKNSYHTPPKEGLYGFKRRESSGRKNVTIYRQITMIFIVNRQRRVSMNRSVKDLVVQRMIKLNKD